MIVSTDAPVILGSILTGDPASRRQGLEGLGLESLARMVGPVERRISRSTAAGGLDLFNDTGLTRSEALQRTFELPPANAAVPHEISADSTPLQIWEGTVVEVDKAAGLMHVLLDAKIGQVPRHTGEIELEWVSEQDQDLARPGAVFYLTLFKRTKRGSIENSQELRFRRRPSWSAAQLRQIQEDATVLLSKMKAVPTAE